MGSQPTQDDKVLSAAAGLFGLATSQLEVAQDISLNGHRPERGAAHLKSALDNLQVQIAEIKALLDALELLLTDDQ